MPSDEAGQNTAGSAAVSPQDGERSPSYEAIFATAMFTLRFSADRGVWNPLKPAEAEAVLRRLTIADADAEVVKAAKEWAEARRKFIGQDYDAQRDDEFKATEEALLDALHALPYVTKDGRILTDAEIEALADEAEKGYDVGHLKERS